jgi:hypothetical protein
MHPFLYRDFLTSMQVAQMRRMRVRKVLRRMKGRRVRRRRV